jgi:hypothetical protein
MWLRILGSEALALVRDDFFVLCIVDCVREADYAESFFYCHLLIIIPLLTVPIYHHPLLRAISLTK